MDYVAIVGKQIEKFLCIYFLQQEATETGISVTLYPALKASLPKTWLPGVLFAGSLPISSITITLKKYLLSLSIFGISKHSWLLSSC
jgi:hypothetical protein